jgi:hypothetical protein
MKLYKGGNFGYFTKVVLVNSSIYNFLFKKLKDKNTTKNLIVSLHYNDQKINSNKIK